MKTRIWITFTSLRNNFRPYSISFSNGYDSNEIQELMLKTNKTVEDKDRIVELNKMINRIRFRYLNFTSIGQVPIRLHHNAEQMVIKPFSLCRILDSFLIISESCANVLMKHNIGSSVIHPVRFQNGDSGKLYYFLNITECRKYMNKEKSDTANLVTVKSVTEGSQVDLKPFAHKDRVIAVSVRAEISELDLWHDPGLRYSIFMSDRLRKELELKGLSADWEIRECRVITSE